VEEALLKVGGSMANASHVSTILFPLDGRSLVPANARGLLQVIKELDDELGGKMQNYKSFQLDTKLNSIELKALRSRDIETWKWENYRDNYSRYCELAQEFKEGDYTAKTLLGDIARDWHPMGFSRRLPEGPSGKQDQSCDVGSWQEILGKAQEFGARVFLIKNLLLSDISGRVLIDFRDAKHNVIPDLGLKISNQ
jgi:hypothetical protein